MKSKYVIIFLLLFTLKAHSQNTAVLNYKVKTAANAKERAEMLDALRAHLYKQVKITLEFVVSHMEAAGNYAWFEGTAQRKDGKKLTFAEEDGYDCCHVEALLQKRAGKWLVAESVGFSTDVWYLGIARKYPAAPTGIWPKGSAGLEGVDVNKISRPVQKKELPLKNSKLVHVLKDKNGTLLGNVYIEDFKNDVFNRLLITKQKEGKTDTLYFIKNYLFTNKEGTDITYSEKDFNGYKIESFKDDSFQMFGIGKNGNGSSDGITIEWDYKKKIFEVFKMAD